MSYLLHTSEGGYEREGLFNDHGGMRYDHAAEPNDHVAGVYERLRLGYERLSGYYDHPPSFFGRWARFSPAGSWRKAIPQRRSVFILQTDTSFKRSAKSSNEIKPTKPLTLNNYAHNAEKRHCVCNAVFSYNLLQINQLMLTVETVRLAQEFVYETFAELIDEKVWRVQAFLQ